ncbi:MAG: hypothetical protein QW255_04940 [Candidatus Bilamarchaeaceae archaeon]
MATPSIVSVSGQKKVIKKEPNVVFYSVDSLTKKQLEDLKKDYHIAKFSFYTKEGNIFIKKDYYLLVKKDYSGDIDEAVHSFLKSKVEFYKKLAPKKEEPKKEELSQQLPLEPLVPSKKEEPLPKKEELKKEEKEPPKEITKKQYEEKIEKKKEEPLPKKEELKEEKSEEPPWKKDANEVLSSMLNIGVDEIKKIDDKREKNNKDRGLPEPDVGRKLSLSQVEVGKSIREGKYTTTNIKNKCKVIKDKNNIPHLFFVSSFTTKDNGTVITFNAPTINEKSIEDNSYERIPIQIEENRKKQIIAYIRIGKSFCVNSEEKEEGIYRLNDEAINFIIAKLKENIDKKYRKYLDQVRENILKNIKIKNKK